MLPTSPSTQTLVRSPVIVAADLTALRQSAGPSYCGMARDFIQSLDNEIGQSLENAKHLQFGKLITCLPKLLFSTVHFLGKLIQGGHDLSSNPVRYGIGGAVKMVANGVDFGIELARSAIDTVILGVKGLAEWWLDEDVETDYINTKLHDGTHKKQVDLYCGAASHLGRLMEVTSSTSQGMEKEDISKGTGLPTDWEKASIEDIPPSIMARRKDNLNFTGEKLALHEEPQFSRKVGNKGLMVLRSDSWSALRVAVFKNKTGKIVLCFQGTDPKKRPGTLKSDVNTILGVRDSASVDADLLVKAFVEKYGKDNVELVGHSLGGNLATDAGLRNKVRVTAFNALGLSLTQRIDQRKRIVGKFVGDKIVGGQSRPETATVTNFNSKKDLLTQKGIQKILPTKQVGVKVRVQGKAGHSTSDVIRDVQRQGFTSPPAKPFILQGAGGG